MATKRRSFIGLPIKELYQILNDKDQIEARKARLIPILKPGDEVALTSVFLASLRLINEFRTMISKNVDLAVSGKIHVFTEIKFMEFDSVRPDGMICIERGGKIVDAALLEMKNGRNDLDKGQIEKYVEITDAYSIPKLITVSNQFVSNPWQSPTSINGRKKAVLYHLSWSFILTLAHILLTDNETNIDDPDQVEIMREVVDYLEHEKSGVSGFTVMKDGWKVLTERINKGENVKPSDKDVIEAAESWLQEERDMALILSRKLGILVETGVKKYRDDLNGRISNEVKKVTSNKYLESTLRVNGAASPIVVKADFNRRNIEFFTNLPAPMDKPTIRGQLGWIKKQIERMKKHPEIFDSISKDLSIAFKFKNLPGEERVPIANLDIFAEEHKSKMLREYGLILLCSLGRNFGSPKISIRQIEESLVAYYQGVVQHLEKWTPPAPEIKKQGVDTSLSNEI